MKNKKISLHIDTKAIHKTIVWIDEDGVKTQESIELQNHTSEQVLPCIEKLLKKTGRDISDITHIYVNPGPGSYTGLRVGAAIAGALGLLLQKPVNDDDAGTPIHLRYGTDAWS